MEGARDSLPRKASANNTPHAKMLGGLLHERGLATQNDPAPCPILWLDQCKPPLAAQLSPALCGGRKSALDVSQWRTSYYTCPILAAWPDKPFARPIGITACSCGRQRAHQMQRNAVSPLISDCRANHGRTDSVFACTAIAAKRRCSRRRAADAGSAWRGEW
ncbi:hypothetical protein ANO11243_000550 [Dothideomycetidae sp. 11243]|nr:hypothetical protein ANO11243_000550 [fungal sp. No.11243]